MFILDDALIGGLRFVLDKIAAAVDAEMNNEATFRERLLEAQLKLENGEISEDEFAAIERDVLAKIREIKIRQRGEMEEEAGAFKVTGVEAEFTGEEHEK